MAHPVPVVFLSSTSDDLKEHRAQAAEAAREMGFSPLMMEYFPAAGDQTSLPKCREMVDAAELVIVLVAHRYGWVPEDPVENPDRRSITWLECDYARRVKGIEVLSLLIDPKYIWPRGFYEEYEATEARKTKPRDEYLKVLDEVERKERFLEEFKNELSRYFRRTFTDAASVRPLVMAALADWRRRQTPDPPSTPSTTTVPGDPSAYLDGLREETSHFEVQGLTFGDNKAYRFPIGQFYIPLTTSTSVGAEMRSGSIPLLDALALHRKLLVVGDPGSGKSTFLKRVAFQLCNEYALGRPLPVRIDASVFSNYISQQMALKQGPADPCSPEWIAAFVGAHCDDNNRNLSAGYVRAMLRAGQCYVLIDGLDEAPDEVHRERLVQLIRAAAGAFKGCRFVVTSRPEGKVPIRDFEEVLIGDLEPEAIREFLAKLASLLYPADAVKERQFRTELEGAVNGRREIRKMTRNPVMLTALAVLQHNNVKLPEKRVDLYGSILVWLSKQRTKKPGRLPADECLLRLRGLALAMQDHEDGRRRQVKLGWAGDKLAKYFGGREAAEKFLRAEQTDSGIVVSRGNEIGYWHLTFQEYLAALEIAGWEDAEQFKLLVEGADAKIYKPEWREPVLLYAGLLHNAGPRKVDALLRRVLDKMGERPGLADRARCVGLIGAVLPDLVGYKIADGRYEESLGLVMDIFDAEKSKRVPFADRLAAAEALGQAGDPRLKGHEWVTIPESRGYWIGAQKNDKEAWPDETLRKVDLASFRIGKYPVTVGQYSRFVEEGTAPDREPQDWEGQQEHPNWPVVNVTWHQATAYCAWAGGRLPTEEEWERAARGPKCTKYPWGNDDVDPSRANYAESKVSHPTPVGLYPSGASEERVLDLIGNVLEWTASEWSEGSGTRVWRGGSFDYDRRYARSSYRDDNQPDVLLHNLGFRLAGGIT